MVRRQNHNAARSVDWYHRAALACCGCWSQVIASHTLMSIKYEVIGCLGVGTQRPGAALAFQQWQLDAPAFADRAHGHNASELPAAFGNDKSLGGKILKKGQALAPKLRDAEILHLKCTPKCTV